MANWQLKESSAEFEAVSGSTTCCLTFDPPYESNRLFALHCGIKYVQMTTSALQQPPLYASNFTVLKPLHHALNCA